MSIENFNSDDLLELAIRSRHNSIVLKNAANALLMKDSTKNHGLFLLRTASEEHQKALFVMMAHRGILKTSQLVPIFSNHATKIILFKMIFRNSKFHVKNGKFYLDETLLENLDLEQLAISDKTFYKDYMNKRNDHLYVKPNSDNTTYDPSQMIPDVEKEKGKIIDQMSYLNAFFDVIWVHDFVGDFGDFDYCTLYPKGQKKKYQFTFSGSGELVERKNYKPEGFERRLGKLLD